MTRISSRSGTRPIISRIARRTIGPIVSSSLRVGRTRLTVTPWASLRLARRRRSANSAWWKFDSPNQRSTRAGMARASSAARSAAARVSAFSASCSKVPRLIGSRVLTTTTVGLARVAIASGMAPNSEASPPPGVADAPMTTRSARSASRRMALRTLLASRTSGSARPLMWVLMNAARARSAWARTARVIPGGTRCRTMTSAPFARPRASANVKASSAWGPPRTGTRIRLTWGVPRCLTTTMSQGDSRTTASMVGLNTVGPVSEVRARRRPLAGRSAPVGAVSAPGPGSDCLPPQPKMIRSASCSAAASTMPSAARRPIRTRGWMAVPGGA